MPEGQRGVKNCLFQASQDTNCKKIFFMISKSRFPKSGFFGLPYNAYFNKDIIFLW